MRLHPRHFTTVKAGLEIPKPDCDTYEEEFAYWTAGLGPNPPAELIAWRNRHGLTTGEYVGLIAQQLADGAKYMIRQERHGDADKRGSEA